MPGGRDRIYVAKRKNFFILDEGTPASILAPPDWKLIARDAFNGVVLWKREITRWHPHLWPHKSGPAQLPRRLVAEEDRVYVTLRLDAPVTRLDAATGETLHTYEGTRGTEEILLSEGILFLLINRDPEAAAPRLGPRLPERSTPRADRFWDETPRLLMAVDAKTGETLWSRPQRVVPCTLAADARNVVFHDGECLVALDRRTGRERWQSGPAARPKEIRAFFAPTLVLYDGVVLFSGGLKAGVQGGQSYTETGDAITALSAETGEPLWTVTHPPSGYRSPQDVLVAGGLVWTGETMSPQAAGVFTGRDPHTGEVKQEFPPNVDTYWFHHRCYRGKATENYLLMSRTGIELVDFRREHWHINHWVRGACLYGIMPANGLLYAPQHPCACYPEAKLDGFNALAPAGTGERIPQEAMPRVRLEKGPAYDDVAVQAAGGAAKSVVDEWPTYRADAARSGAARTTVPDDSRLLWETDLGGRLTSPVVAGGKLFVAAVDAHTVYALDAASGEVLWHFVAGGPVDSPPTVDRKAVLFGCRDGWVYCLRADDGVLAWRFLAAPIDERLVAFDRLESAWPVHGSVLVLEGIAWFAAGRSAFLDGGIRLWRVDAATGHVLSETVLDDTDAATGKQHQEFVRWLNMPPALPDILSSDGRFVYMWSQPFELDGTRPPLEPMPVGPDGRAPPATQREEHAHLFSPTGFLDDTSWHRTYWLYGSRFVGGAPGYYLAGRAAPAGRILVFDDDRVYGFGRKPQFFRWTTPMAYHLFAADRTPPPNPQPRKPDFWRENVPVAVKHHWTQDVPLYTRAMVLAGRTLFLAGPKYLLDEQEAFRQLFDPQTQAALARRGASGPPRQSAPGRFDRGRQEVGRKTARLRPGRRRDGGGLRKTVPHDPRRQRGLFRQHAGKLGFNRPRNWAMSRAASPGGAPVPGTIQGPSDRRARLLPGSQPLHPPEPRPRQGGHEPGRRSSPKPMTNYLLINL
ncbi:MAG: PQQ-binding-like beta-propeller repeat protein [Thermoguttaceae bacterium]|nr:PQQ-binding-like beta-propeller repeat protein [Thermoguttaceae bacterium]